MKAVINCAIDDDKLSANVLKGFHKVNISRKSISKKIYALNMDELRRIYHLNLGTVVKRIKLYNELIANVI